MKNFVTQRSKNIGQNSNLPKLKFLIKKLYLLKKFAIYTNLIQFSDALFSASVQFLLQNL